MKTSFITKVFVFVSFLVLSMSAQSEDLSQALIDKYADSIKFLKSSDLGFSSLDSWALIGDKVGGAMAAINLQNEPVRPCIDEASF